MRLLFHCKCITFICVPLPFFIYIVFELVMLIHVTKGVLSIFQSLNVNIKMSNFDPVNTMKKYLCILLLCKIFCCRSKCEWGKKNAVASNTSENAVYNWMAPEVMMAMPPSFYCDMYSFCAVLWEMFHGKLNFLDVNEKQC